MGRSLQVILLTVAMLALPGCQAGNAAVTKTAYTTVTEVVTTLPVTYFPVQTGKYNGGAFPLDALVGKLYLENGCLCVSGNPDIPNKPIIIWPSGFALRTNNGKLQVFNTSKNLVFNLGDVVEVGGGEVPPSIVEKYTGALPPSSDAPYFLAGSIVHQ